MNTANPALNERYFQGEGYADNRASAMTVQGAVIKTLLLTTIMVCVAAVAWGVSFPNGVPTQKMVSSGDVNTTALWGFLLGGGIGGFILGLIMCFKPKASPILAPLYAACEGGFVGAISGLYTMNFPGVQGGIVLQAAMLTIGTLVVMLTAYMTGIIKVTEKLRTGIIAATGGIMLVYLATMLLRMFGVQIPYIHGSGLIGIGFSAVVVTIAALNLVLDFDTIENGARMNAPKYMEWYSAYGLLVTLVWLYLEILRLLAKLNSSRD